MASVVCYQFAWCFGSVDGAEELRFQRFRRLLKTLLLGCWDRGTLRLTVKAAPHKLSYSLTRSLNHSHVLSTRVQSAQSRRRRPRLNQRLNSTTRWLVRRGRHHSARVVVPRVTCRNASVSDASTTRTNCHQTDQQTRLPARWWSGLRAVAAESRDPGFRSLTDRDPGRTRLLRRPPSPPP